MAEKIEVAYCPSCGAPVKFLEGREDTFCSSCGHQLFREDKHLEAKLKLKEEELKFEVKKDDRKNYLSDRLKKIFTDFLEIASYYIIVGIALLALALLCKYL